MLYEEFLKAAKADLGLEHEQNEAIFNKLCAELGVRVSDTPLKDEASAKFITKSGKRSLIVEQESKFCDMVVAAVPLDGKITGTFEAAVLKSGKNVIAIPRKLTKFSTENILVSWTGTPESSRAITSSLPLLKEAKRVKCITSKANLGDQSEVSLKRLDEYFTLHGINADFEVVGTFSVPGEPLLKAATDGNFDLIVAARYAENGFREIFLGGTTKYFLQNTTIPVFM